MHQYIRGAAFSGECCARFETDKVLAMANISRDNGVTLLC